MIKQVGEFRDTTCAAAVAVKRREQLLKVFWKELEKILPSDLDVRCKSRNSAICQGLVWRSMMAPGSLEQPCSKFKRNISGRNRALRAHLQLS